MASEIEKAGACTPAFSRISSEEEAAARARHERAPLF